MKSKDIAKITSCPMTANSSSYCDIEINNEKYLVLWHWSSTSRVSLSACTQPTNEQCASDNELDCLSMLRNLQQNTTTADILTDECSDSDVSVQYEEGSSDED
jgi:hypothetical protein